MPTDVTTSRPGPAPRPAGDVREGDLLWTPSPERAARTNLAAFTAWAQQGSGRTFDGYPDLWAWSVEHTEDFWALVWEYFEVRSSQPYDRVLDSRRMPGTRWFPGARLNFAEHILRNEQGEQPALYFAGERAGVTPVSWTEFAGSVRVAATRLREMGVRPGDRVVGYLPNIPEAVIGMVATTAIGAVWSACSPDFGVTGAVDRLGQLEPTVLLCAEAYQYGGRTFDRAPQIRDIAAQLPTLRAVVSVRASDRQAPPIEGAVDWSDFLDHPGVAPADFEFEQVPFDHPLWVLFSSGTTGKPKAIVHGHGGILLEHLKFLGLHVDLRPGDRFFWYSSTSWMVWNVVVSSLLTGASVVLYDGSPTHPQHDQLWRLVADQKVTVFGTSAGYLHGCVKEELRPARDYDIEALRALHSTGSPLSADGFRWAHEHVGTHVLVFSGSGGTDVATAFVGGNPLLPVRVGEIPGPMLGADVQAWDDDGKPVIGQVGELVVVSPMPSMPLYFWNDADGARYRASYFDTYPGVWRHGDWIEFTDDGSAVIHGRSDSTLNRMGVRMGTAEIYQAVEALPEVAEALAIGVDGTDGEYWLPLFVALREGHTLDDALRSRIVAAIRRDASPRHVPDDIIGVPGIPHTLTGKKLEVPVKKILLGRAPAIDDPDLLDVFATVRRRA